MTEQMQAGTDFRRRRKNLAGKDCVSDGFHVKSGADPLGTKVLSQRVKKASPFLTRGDRGLPQRTRCPLSADNSHVCRPRCIFSGVHAAGENDFIRFRFCGSGTLRGFFNSLGSRSVCQRIGFILFIAAKRILRQSSAASTTFGVNKLIQRWYAQS